MRSKSIFNTKSIHIICVLLFLLLSIVTGPDNFRAPHKLLPDLQDTVLAMALMTWPAHCIQSAQCSIADFPIFYPEKGALFFTDSLIGLGLIFNSLRTFLSLQLSYNLSLLTLSSLNFYSFFLLMRFAHIRYPAAFFSSTVFAAIPYVFQFGSHIQLYALFLWPLALLFLLKFFEAFETRWLYWLTIVLACTFYLSMSIAIKQFFFVGLAFLILFLSAKKASLFDVLHFRWLVAILSSSLIGLFILLPLAYQYYQVRKIHPFTREIGDSVQYSLDVLALPRYILSYVVPDFALDSWGLRIDNLQKYSDLALGGLTPWMTIIAISFTLYLFRGSNPLRNSSLRIQRLITISIVSLIMSAILMLGPTIVIAGNPTGFPSLYQLFYYVVPGFKALRVPVRFVVPLVINASIVFGVCLDYYLKILIYTPSKKEKLAAFVFTAVLMMAFVVDRSFPYSKRSVAWTEASIPVVYDVVKANPGLPVLELPMWPPSKETFKYFYYQMQDWNPRLGGISSFFPKHFYQLRGHMKSCPSQECFDTISKSEAEILIVDLTSLNHDKQKSWVASDLNPYEFYLQEESDNETMIWLRGK